ncbi:NlpC/P60 family protein [Pseudomonas huaxiensis]|uniref:C40 family peptidase n=1 Tax=Pseudomonas huaxiensis TaxID=2213017 RepID=UPI000DA6C9B5|nr:C40 family peptidase [Pseudomonas huaxiensis]
MLARFCLGGLLLATIPPCSAAQAQITGPFDLPIGNGLGQVGIERIPNEECRGPATIAPGPNGQLAILDSVNQKILIVGTKAATEIKLPPDLLDPVDLIATTSGYVVVGALGDVALVSATSRVSARSFTRYDPESGAPRLVVLSDGQLTLENLAGKQVPIDIDSKVLGALADPGQVAASFFDFKLEKPTLAVGRNAISTTGFKQTSVSSERRLVDVRMLWASADEGALIATQETVKAPKELSFVRLITTDVQGTLTAEAYMSPDAYACNIRRPFARLTNGVVVSLSFAKNGKVTVEPVVFSKVGTAKPVVIARPTDVALIASEQDILKQLEQLNGTSAVGLVALQQVSRQSILKKAREALELKWVMHANNYSRTGVPNLCNPSANIWHRPSRLDALLEKEVTAIPYRWGGYASSLDTFRQHLSDGRLAGSDCTCRSSNCVYPAATGLDCSGFVSYAWQTGAYYTTRSLPDAKVSAAVLWENLRPGDIVNKSGSHVRLLESTANGPKGRFHTVIESAANASCGGVCRRSYSEAELMQAGYKPLSRLDLTP